jgi:chemotaxis signal transduction protein
MDDLLREFLTETNESLDTVDNQLVKFEQDPNDAKILDNIFRLVQTIGEVLRLPDDSREENPVNLDPRMAKLAGGVHRLDGQLMVVLDVDRVLEIVPKTALAA